MSETIDKDRREALIRRIAGLMAKTTSAGCTEEEAMAAANLASKLMADYDLSLSDIKLKEQANLMQDGINTGFKNMDQPALRCSMAIAYLTDTRVYHWIDKNRAVSIKFFGFETDVVLAKYIYMIVDRAITYSTLRWEFGEQTDNFEWRDLSRQRKEYLRKSFEAGMVDRINERLREMKRARREEARSTGRDLVTLKDAIVNEQWADLYKKLGLRAGKARKSTTVNADAYRQGVAEANKVAFNSGIGQSAEVAKIR
jgi:hypothetical protein